jgi:hypothetical protein
LLRVETARAAAVVLADVLAVLDAVALGTVADDNFLAVLVPAFVVLAGVVDPLVLADLLLAPALTFEDAAGLDGADLAAVFGADLDAAAAERVEPAKADPVAFFGVSLLVDWGVLAVVVVFFAGAGLAVEEGRADFCASGLRGGVRLSVIQSAFLLGQYTSPLYHASGQMKVKTRGIIGQSAGFCKRYFDL